MTTTTDKQAVHFAPRDLMDPVHPILINLIGVGGTGSHVLAGLADINTALLALGHPGFVVRAFDQDNVSSYNLGRQRLSRTEIGLPKAATIINRINRFYGTYWQAMLFPYAKSYKDELKDCLPAQITVSCVDSVQTRLDIEDILKEYIKSINRFHHRSCPVYWLDFGNSRYTGQVVLSTLTDIPQPESKKYLPVAVLPLFTQEFREDLRAADDRQEPSCSMQEALTRQDLFINPTLAMLGCRLLWTLISHGMTEYRGVFLNLLNYKTGSIPVGVAMERIPPPESKLQTA